MEGADKWQPQLLLDGAHLQPQVQAALRTLAADVAAGVGADSARCVAFVCQHMAYEDSWVVGGSEDATPLVQAVGAFFRRRLVTTEEVLQHLHSSEEDEEEGEEEEEEEGEEGEEGEEEAMAGPSDVDAALVALLNTKGGRQLLAYEGLWGRAAAHMDAKQFTGVDLLAEVDDSLFQDVEGGVGPLLEALLACNDATPVALLEGFFFHNADASRQLFPPHAPTPALLDKVLKGLQPRPVSARRPSAPPGGYFRFHSLADALEELVARAASPELAAAVQERFYTTSSNQVRTGAMAVCTTVLARQPKIKRWLEHMVEQAAQPASLSAWKMYKQAVVKEGLADEVFRTVVQAALDGSASRTLVDAATRTLVEPACGRRIQHLEQEVANLKAQLKVGRPSSTTAYTGPRDYHWFSPHEAVTAMHNILKHTCPQYVNRPCMHPAAPLTHVEIQICSQGLDASSSHHGAVLP
jgi:hypothetical protein